MGKVTINSPKTPVTKGSSGVASATLPNVCKMPGPPAPFVPTPLPNIGKSGNSPQGYSKTVTIEGHAVAITGASFGSQGDMASKGTGGGLVSSNTHGLTKFIGPGSMNVQIEGKNVQLLSDPVLNNCGPSGSPANAATMTGIIQGSGLLKIIYGDDKPCSLCGKTHPLEAGPETLEAIATLFKELKKVIDKQTDKIREYGRLIREERKMEKRHEELMAKDVAKHLGKGLNSDQKAEITKLQGELAATKAELNPLKSFFKNDAVLRFNSKYDTFTKGYMIGVMICVCQGKKLAACSGLAPGGFKKAVESVARGHASPRAFYVDKVAEGVASIAAAFWPKPVIVRLSDFKSNEYRKLIGGSRYEPEEENPMLGFRGATRYISEDFREAFAMECEALKRVRGEMGLTNVQVMVPFVRTLKQAERVTQLLASHGLVRGENELKLIMMCEVPTNAILADRFLQFFDGFSIGSNDLTQLTLGLDRDSGMELLAADFDERDPAVTTLIAQAIAACRAQGKYIGICGQGPSDHPDFARWLMEQGISSISLNPDTVVETWTALGKASA